MTEKPGRSRRTPQERKTLSWERDRVNVYGENSKSSRKAIPRFKAGSNRVMRRTADQLLERLPREDANDGRLDAALADTTAAGLRSGKRKVPDMPQALALDERPQWRKAGADRIPTHNRRESLRAQVGIKAQYETVRGATGRGMTDDE